MISKFMYQKVDANGQEDDDECKDIQLEKNWVTNFFRGRPEKFKTLNLPIYPLLLNKSDWMLDDLAIFSLLKYYILFIKCSELYFQIIGRTKRAIQTLSFSENAIS